MKGRSQRQDQIEGLIERVTFFNEDNGFAILKVKVRKERDLVTLLGNVPSVTPGEWAAAEGQWVRNKQHGLQFQASSLRLCRPETAEGIEKYLGSGMVKGIGPVYARKLVRHFGPRVFDVIENTSAQLEEVDGIGPSRRRKIKEAWAVQKHIREIMVFLHGHGVSSSRAVRIYKTYGDQAAELVTRNPYTLARDIPGIGFHTADQIALKVGLASDSPLRAIAGLDHVLSTAASEGNCALPTALLVAQTTTLLKIDEGIVEKALRGQIAANDLVEAEMDGEALIFSKRLYDAESSIAEALIAMIREPPSYPAIQIEKAIQWRQERWKIELSDGQKEALRAALERRLLIITGGPGVGKTTFLSSLLGILSAKKVRTLLCAPTGRAAKRLSEATGQEAKTIHRLLEYQPGQGFTRGPRNPLECDLLIVDEASMLDTMLMNQLLRAHPPGAGLILVGDVDQLPSVGPGNLLRDMIGSNVIPTARLTHIFRQSAGSQIVLAAHAINEGKAPPQMAGDDSDFFFIERGEPAAILKTLCDLVAVRVPRKLGCDRIRDIQVLCPMNRGSLGVLEMNRQLQNRLNPAREGEPVTHRFGWEFRVRDKVLQTVNNYDKEVFNGDIGWIERIDLDEQEMDVRFDGRLVNYEFGELDELSLAYALTVHKSQGSEYPVVVIPVSTQHFTMLQRNLLYTGITRGRKLVILIGQKKALDLAIRNNRTAKRYSGLNWRLRNGVASNGEFSAEVPAASGR